ncbi:GAF and ANTAR domain-containing protein [Kribbella sp. NPDC026611]|uniref:GAF and ANTAR domain-containing protein n=1 Tax=Kribbella sp. NPDC026611 TaxID=3154911 RepID=UPI0033F50096
MAGGRSSTLSEVLAGMAAGMSSCVDEESAAWIAVARAEEALPGWAAAVALVRRRRPVHAACNPSLRPIEQSQLEAGQGPLIDAAETGQVAQCADLAVSTAWPDWTPAASRSGWRSILCLPLLGRGGRRTAAVVTFAHPRPDQLDDGTKTVAELVATYAAIGLETVGRLANLTVAGDSQASIGLAIGVLMERFELSEAQAFAVLRRYSQDRQRKLREVATDLLNTGQLPPD